MIHSIDIPDLAALSDEAAAALLPLLDAHIEQVATARRRLAVRVAGPGRVAEVAAEVLEARDGVPPSDGSGVRAWPVYQPPTGAHDAYVSRYVVRVGSRLWRARRDGVAHSPAEAPEEWDDVTDLLAGTPAPTVPTAAPWVPGGTFRVGDRREFNGVVYVAVQSHTNYDPGHTPPLTPALWAVARPAQVGI